MSLLKKKAHKKTEENKSRDGLAIAYSMKKKAKKMYEGGLVGSDEGQRSAQYEIDKNKAHLVVPMGEDEADKRARKFYDKRDSILKKK